MNAVFLCSGRKTGQAVSQDFHSGIALTGAYALIHGCAEGKGTV